MWRAAHSLKSSSANVGALRLAGLCRELETLGRAGSADKAAELVEAIEGEYARVCAALEGECGR